MCNFIDYGLYVIIQLYNEFISELDVIMIGDFYEALPIQDSWIFKITNTFNIIAISYWSKYVQCYKLQVMWQNNIDSINILNRFWTTSQTIGNIKFMNNNYYKMPSMGNALPYLFYTNVKKQLCTTKMYLKTHQIKHSYL